jgi:hypothetical protein
MYYGLKPGDRVNLILNADRNLIPNYSNHYRYKEDYEIIGIGEGGYVVYVPPYRIIRGEFVIKNTDLQKYGIDIKFVGEKSCYINTNVICGIHSKMDGMTCCRCKEFYKYAEANESGGVFRCYLCRTYKYR